MKPRAALVWLASCAIPLVAAPAAGQFGSSEEVRPYLTLTLGTAFTPSPGSERNLDQLSPQVKTESGPNLAIGGGIGAIHGYVRHELRVDYHREKLARVVLAESNAVGAVGETLDVMTILYTVALRQTLLDDRLAVYAGIGLGAAYGVIPIGTGVIDDWEFGYSAGGGVFYDLWRGIGLDLGYRYVAATDFTEDFPQIPESQFGPDKTPYGVSWGVHEAILSLRYEWGAGD